MGTVTLRIDDKTKARLEKLAGATSRTKSYLINHAIADYLEVNEWQVREIKKGIREADAGHLMDHKTVLKKWESRRANKVD